MDFISDIKALIPDYAKDIRLNMDSTIARSTLQPADAIGAALAAAYAAKSGRVVNIIRASGAISESDANAALTAAALMAMNNSWYPFVEMSGDAELKTRPAQLRMQAYATHGGIDKTRFELFALAASIVGKCHFCVQSHYVLLKESGISVDQLRDVGRIAAVVAAAANAIAVTAAAETQTEPA